MLSEDEQLTDFGESREGESREDGLEALSPRESEVLAMTAQGLTNSQMAAQLGVTVHSIKFHLASIFRKLGVANRTEAAVAYLRIQSTEPNATGNE